MPASTSAANSNTGASSRAPPNATKAEAPIRQTMAARSTALPARIDAPRRASSTEMIRMAVPCMPVSGRGHQAMNDGVSTSRAPMNHCHQQNWAARPKRDGSMEDGTARVPLRLWDSAPMKPPHGGRAAGRSPWFPFGCRSFRNRRRRVRPWLESSIKSVSRRLETMGRVLARTAVNRHFAKIIPFG